MFREIENNPATVSITIEGKPYEVPAGISVAAAVLLSGFRKVRNTPVTQSPRLPYCMMGVCFDCLMKIDNLPNQQACQILVRKGMNIEIQDGASELDDYL
jgi:succinate dehydrogenase/fumarate reductase-like Fe-S protein